MRTSVPRGISVRELKALAAGVQDAINSPEYQRTLHSSPAEALNSLDRETNPLPGPVLLEGPDDGRIFERLVPLIGRYGYRVEVVDELDEDPQSNGVAWHGRQLVQINGTRSPRHQAKTAAHEFAHVALHGPNGAWTLPGRERELEAETFAWVLMRRHGIDSGSYSFPHLAKYGVVRWNATSFSRLALTEALRVASVLASFAIALMPAAETLP